MRHNHPITVSVFHGEGDIEELSLTQWSAVFALIAFHPDIASIHIGWQASHNGTVAVSRGSYVHIIRR